MGADSKIEWTTHTFNPWRGCTKVSAGCAHCYAETMSGRNPKVLGVWGKSGTRVVASEVQWKEPVKWDRLAVRAQIAWLNSPRGSLANQGPPPERPRVFCASLADVFEGAETMPADAVDAVTKARKRLGQLILDTPNLDWLLLTKRPQNVLTVARDMWVRFDDSYPLPPNVWVGTSVENQAAADSRIPELLKVPAAVRFLSCEPLLGPVSLTNQPWWDHRYQHAYWRAAYPNARPPIDWCIVGGESGPGARPFNVEWARSLVRQCQTAGVTVFVKQLGAVPQFQTADMHGPQLLALRDKKGGDIEEFPEDLRVREFPEVRA